MAMLKITREQTKEHNTKLVLKVIYDHDTISRAEVARITKLTRTTVSSVVDELLTQGLIMEVGLGRSRGGKPPTLLAIRKDSRHIIGIDLSNEEITGSLINLRGEILHTEQLLAEDVEGLAFVELIYQLIDRLMAKTNQPLLGIGIGCPGIVNPNDGMLRWSVNLKLVELPLEQLLEEHYNLPVYVVNDSQATALAQYLFGDRNQTANLVVIRLSKGLGAGIVINGELFQGDMFGAGEIGHVTVVENGRQCRCGNNGCLETVATERALIAEAREQLPDHPQSLLNQICPNLDTLSLDDLIQAIHAGDEFTLRLAQRSGQYLGRAIAFLVGTINPKRIYLVGHLTRLDKPWMDAIQREMQAYSLGALSQHTEVHISSLEKDAVILGTTALLLTRELGVNAFSIDGYST